MAFDDVHIYVLHSQGIPAASSSQAAQPPFQLLVYNLPPPPPGFLYGFTCSPVSFRLPPVVIAPLPDSRSPSSSDLPTSEDQSRTDRSFPQGLPDVPSTEIVSSSSYNAEEPLSPASDVLADFQPPSLGEIRSNLDKWPTAASSSCTEPTEFPSDQPQSALTDENSLALHDQEYINSSTSLNCALADSSDEAIQESNRLNMIPSLGAQKAVGTSSQNGSTLPIAKKLQESAADISSYRLPVLVAQQELRDRIVERWRTVIETINHKDSQDRLTKPPDRKFSDERSVCNTNVSSFYKLMDIFSCGSID